MNHDRLLNKEFFGNCYLYAFFLLPLPFLFLFAGAPFWSYLLWALFIVMAARIETLRNEFISMTLDKEAYQFRLEQVQRTLYNQRAEAERTRESLLSWISALEKTSEEHRKEIQRLRHEVKEHSPLEPTEFCISTFGIHRPIEPASDISHAA